ncbi:MAG: D-alanine--D-alanine ligase family protein [Anaerovoracaceae bacterium]
MIRLGIIFGGRSEEHEISCMSAVSVMGAVDRSKYEIVMIGITKQGEWLLYDGPAEGILSGQWQQDAEKALRENPEKYSFSVLGSGGRTLKEIVDFVLPVVHGTYCEDGTLQGLLEMADIPYGGCGVAASAVAMDKITAKDVFVRAGLPVCGYVATSKEAIDEDLDAVALDIQQKLGYPIYVKPANMGSSVGISKAADLASLKEGLLLAARYDRRILAEEGVNCREIETAVLGNYRPEASVPGEIVATEDFYDYDSKYIDDGKPKMKIPADLPQELADTIRSYAVRAFGAIDGAGFARCDFFLDKDNGNIYINEINTIPGFTQFSMFPLLWENSGLPYSETIERIIRLGYERYNAKNHRKADQPQ